MEVTLTKILEKPNKRHQRRKANKNLSLLICYVFFFVRIWNPKTKTSAVGNFNFTFSKQSLASSWPRNKLRFPFKVLSNAHNSVTTSDIFPAFPLVPEKNETKRRCHEHILCILVDSEFCLSLRKNLDLGSLLMVRRKIVNIHKSISKLKWNIIAKSW